MSDTGSVGRNQYTLEVLSADHRVAEELLASVRTEMAASSVLRGQVLSFAANAFDNHGAGAGLTFLERPRVQADQVILPGGVLERIHRHVVGIGEQRDLLQRSGQHLKRGVLLYGPPGTGKTHVIRHLLGVTKGVTAILLSGQTLGMIHHATDLARAAQPAVVVLEDCDLIAEHRGGDTKAALFETLEEVAAETPGVTASFAKELIRRTVLDASAAGRDPSDTDLLEAVAEMMSDSETFTRTLLGAGEESPPAAG